ncbi:alcohol dehydrogenase catalytic domain-containing protein [Actinomycetes bacterium KLBMP 9797]
MRAYRIIEWGAPPRAVEVPAPEPGPGQVLVRVGGCGLCRSDLRMPHLGAAAAHLGWTLPFTLGHETAGWIAELGPGVTGWAPGDPVALVSATSCGTCWHCLRGLDSACPRGRTGRGYGRDGGLADHVLVEHPRGLLRLGGLDPRTAGPLTDAGATAYHAVRRALPRIAPDGTVAVLGAGGLGGFAIQFLRALTAARVVAVDVAASALERAGSLGAHETLSGVDGTTARALRKLSGGRGVDAVLDFVGVDQTIAAGLAALRPAGAYGLVGAGGGRLDAPWFGTLPADAEIFTHQGSTIADAQEVLALAAAGLVRNEVVEFPFDQVADAYDRLAAGTLAARAVITLTPPPS